MGGIPDSICIAQDTSTCLKKIKKEKNTNKHKGKVPLKVDARIKSGQYRRNFSRIIFRVLIFTRLTFSFTIAKHNFEK
jgi:hypothetical protein